MLAGCIAGWRLVGVAALAEDRYREPVGHPRVSGSGEPRGAIPGATQTLHGQPARPPMANPSAALTMPPKPRPRAPVQSAIDGTATHSGMWQTRNLDPSRGQTNLAELERRVSASLGALDGT
jgi:hypothetical protein